MLFSFYYVLLIVPKVLYVPGVPPATHTQPTVPPLDGVVLYTISPADQEPIVGTLSNTHILFCVSSDVLPAGSEC